MKSKMMNVITVGDLEKALCLQYGEGFMEDIGYNLRSFLFNDHYMDDNVYKIYYFDELIERNIVSWIDEDHARVENCIKAFLQDTFPGYDSVLIDVTW